MPNRLSRWRLPFVTASLLGTMMMSVVGAVAIHQAGKEHDRAVRAEMEEFLSSVSQLLISTLPYSIKSLSLRAFAPLVVAAPGESVPFERYVEHASVVLRGDLGEEPLRGFFRLDLRSGAYQATGPDARPKVEAAIRAAVRDSDVNPKHPRGPSVVFATLEGTPAAVFLYRELDREGKAVAAIGFTMSQAHWFRTVLGGTMAEFPMSPPAALSSKHERSFRADTVIAVELLQADGKGNTGAQLYASQPRFHSELMHRNGFGLGNAHFQIHASLHPRATERVLAAHRHPERAWFVVALPLLSILLGLSAIVNQRRERELLRARHDFVASVSHELRTPLAQIRMFAETLLLGRDRDEAERRKWLGVIRRESVRLGDLVENILFFTHLERAGLRIAPERTDLAALVDEIAHGYAPLAAVRHARLEVRTADGVTADVDPRALRQVLVNLLDNALKYGPEGQTVRLRLEREGAFARLSVSDEGPGIPPEDRERVWRPFVRLTERGGTAGGSGLGLSVARSIAQQHHGEMAIDDAPGGGARFSVLLPLALPAPASPGATDATDVAAD